ncbi:tripartite tricarboxylate transporter TctB family protein [Salimicrobium halophilum]|uniref:tripartite tricarboxylate transporter TctB family protein n=1 Tax=Salimicrobium halophilum TaxID=86666 RepID=UPI002ADD6DEC|nr:tripartite tricarboxylate transporter TctB family protein [Salimicrobium halophilum]
MTSLKALKLIVPFILIIASITYMIASWNLPDANLGNGNGPKYFPLGLSIFMLTFSIVYFIQEFRKRDEENEEIREILSGRTPKLIAFTVVAGFIYSLLFERIGFLFSTVLFLGALLFFINGRKKWMTNIIVTICFSTISWYAFSVLLGVSLP